MEKTAEKVQTLCFACKHRFGSREDEPCKSCIRRAEEKRADTLRATGYQSAADVQKNVCTSCPQLICDPEKEPCKSCISAFASAKNKK